MRFIAKNVNKNWKSEFKGLIKNDKLSFNCKECV